MRAVLVTALAAAVALHIGSAFATQACNQLEPGQIAKCCRRHGAREGFSGGVLVRRGDGEGDGSGGRGGGGGAKASYDRRVTERGKKVRRMMFTSGGSSRPSPPPPIAHAGSQNPPSAPHPSPQAPGQAVGWKTRLTSFISRLFRLRRKGKTGGQGEAVGEPEWEKGEWTTPEEMKKRVIYGKGAMDDRALNFAFKQSDGVEKVKINGQWVIHGKWLRYEKGVKLRIGGHGQDQVLVGEKWVDIAAKAGSPRVPVRGDYIFLSPLNRPSISTLRHMFF